MERRNFLKSSAFFAATSPFYGLASPGNTYSSKFSGLKEPSRTVPYVQQTDVIVCGGGPAGCAAAISAARLGARVQLIELQGFLGGVMTAGLLTYILDYENKDGLMHEIVHRLKDSTTCIHPQTFDAEYMKLLLEEMCLEAGVEIRYHTRVVAAYTQKRRLDAVVTESPSGREAWQAGVFIDTTGNGDLGALAGCSYEVGHPKTGKVQPSSMHLILAGVTQTDLMEKQFIIYPGMPNVGIAKLNLLKEIQKTGVTPSYDRPVLTAIREELIQFATNHEYAVNAMDAQSVTNATINARRECHRIVDGLRKLGGIWKDVRIVASSDQIGLREGRRIRGLYTLTKEDIVNGAKFDDAVCRVTFPVDVHAMDPGEEAFGSHGVRTKPYDIPLRSLISADLDNLLMAGRCISGDFYAHASYRVIGNAIPMGEGAGKAALNFMKA